MKKTVVASMALLLSLFLCLPSVAQDSTLARGSSSLSIGFGFSLLSLFAPITTGDDDIHHFEISPTFEYFVLSRFSLGGRFQHRFTAGKRANTGYTTIGPRLVYYLPFPKHKAGKDRLFPYVAAAASHTWYESISKDNSGQELDRRWRYLTGSLGAGAKYMLSRRTGFFIEMGYEVGRLLDGTERLNPINGMISSSGITFWL